MIGLGWGYWVRRFLGLSSTTPFSVIDLWFAFLVISLAVNIFQLFLPINWVITLGIGCIGFIGLWAIPEKVVWQLVRDSVKYLRQNILICTCSAWLFGLWCLQALRGPINYDAGMYYLSSIRWLNEYPIVPGLANLFPQFGFNHSYFSFVALLNVAPYANSHFALGGIALLSLTTLTLITAHITRLRYGWFLIVLLMVAIGQSAQLLASPAPDMIVGFLEIVLFVNLITIFSNIKHSPDQRMRIVLVVILSIHMVTIKLSSAMFALTCLTLVIPTFYRQCLQDTRSAIRIVGLGIMIFLLHLIRGYIVSGYPLFPSTILGISSLDWIASSEGAQQAAKVIYDYARNEGLPPSQWQSGWKWLPYWWHQQIQHHGWLLLLCLSLLGLNGLLLLWKRHQYADRNLLLLYVPLLSAILFWFFTAPAWRFLGVIPLLLIALSSCLCLRVLVPRSNEAHSTNSSIQTLWCIVAIILSAIALQPKDLSLGGWRPLPGLLIDRNPDHPVAEVIIENKLTRSGLNLVFVPWFQCWNAPLPCTPVYDPNLHLRSYSQEKDMLRSGFSVRQTGDELQPKYQASIKDGIQFSKPGYPNFLTGVKGVSGVEAWGRWTNGSHAHFEFLYPLPKQFTLQIQLRAFGPNVNQAVRIQVGEEVQVIYPREMMQTFRVPFLLTESTNTLTIFIPRAIAPKELNPQDSDTRKLGLGLESLQIID
jgi:hypothetical protein